MFPSTTCKTLILLTSNHEAHLHSIAVFRCGTCSSPSKRRPTSRRRNSSKRRTRRSLLQRRMGHRLRRRLEHAIRRRRLQRVTYSAGYGRGNGQIWIDEINCQGTEKSVQDCGHNPWGVNDCDHSEDAGVACARKQPAARPDNFLVRLSCPEYMTGGTCKACPGKRGPTPGNCSLETAVEGIVQAYVGDKWIPVSGIGWNLNAASVACGELGYPVSTKVPSLDELWPNVDPRVCERLRCGSAEILENNAYRTMLQQRTVMRGLQCAGNERAIRDCYAIDFGNAPLTSEISVATVRCSFTPHGSCKKDSNSEVSNVSGRTMWEESD